MHPAEPSLSDIISKTESLSCTDPMLELIGSDDSGFHVTDNKLVARIIGTRKYCSWVLKSTMSKIWKLIFDVQVQSGPEGSFIFIFEDVKERDEVLEEEPWLLDNNLLILKKWPPDKSFQALDFSTTGFWLQVHGLPPSNWNQQNAQKIGQLFGGLICVDNVQGPSQEWHPFLRLKVRVLVEKPLLTGFFIAQGGEKKDWIKFKYERLSIFCLCCGIIGHIARNCNGKLNGDIVPPSRFGLWLLAKSPNPHPYQRTLHLQSHFNKTQVPNASVPSLLLDLPSDQVVCSSGMGL
ncbi:uncharacterized protein LOC131182828 [Hevea brasiliensis]|uniref:uncharacterized protein LOC131182828 n=1 Tax=Hevea brasiliensis TaxID=3981 RepID=UPI0025F4D4A7|nr:uncharacterized protein LOC131182828 [Hevea brasiliensis]